MAMAAFSTIPGLRSHAGDASLAAHLTSATYPDRAGERIPNSRVLQGGTRARANGERGTWNVTCEHRREVSGCSHRCEGARLHSFIRSPFVDSGMVRERGTCKRANVERANVERANARTYKLVITSSQRTNVQTSAQHNHPITQSRNHPTTQSQQRHTVATVYTHHSSHQQICIEESPIC